MHILCGKTRNACCRVQALKTKIWMCRPTQILNICIQIRHDAMHAQRTDTNHKTRQALWMWHANDKNVLLNPRKPTPTPAWTIYTNTLLKIENILMPILHSATIILHWQLTRMTMQKMPTLNYCPAIKHCKHIHITTANYMSAPKS